MPVRQVTLQEALDKGYEILGPAEAGRTAPPTLLENAELFAWEVAPALLGSIVGSFVGPGGTIAGGGAGSALGNLWAQQTRIEMGLSDDIGLGELGAATVAGAIPFGKLAKAGFKTKVALRGMQGAGIATGETVARTLIDEQRAPTENEIKMSLLFGFGIGGTMGAVEAKYFNDATGTRVAQAGDTKEDLVPKLMNEGMDEQTAIQTIDDASVNLYDNIGKWQQEMGQDGIPIAERYYGAKTAFNDPAAVEGQPLQNLPSPEKQLGIPNQKRLLLTDTPVPEREALESSVVADLKASMTDLGTETILDTKKLKNIQQQISAFTKQTSLKKPQKKRLKALQKQEQYMLEQIPQDQLPLGYTEQYRRIRTLEDKLDYIEAQLPNAPKNERGMLAKERSELRKALNEERNYLTKEEAQAKGLLSNRKFQEYLMSGGLTSGAGLSMLATDEDGEMKTASIEQLLGIGLMAALGLAAKRKFFPKRPVKVNTRKNGTKFTAEDTPNEVHQSNVSRVINDDITYLPPTKVQNMVRSAKELVGSWLTPLSRQAKQINPVISSIFRKYEQELAGTRKLWKDSTLPFWQQLQKVIPKGHDDASLLKLAYLNRDTQTIEQLAGKYGVNFSQHGNYAKQTREIHRQAVEEAGIDMGFFEDYNPRKLKRNAYQQFRKELEKRGMKSELNAIDEAMLDYAKKNGMGVEELSEWERAAITSKVLSNDMKNPLGGKGDFSKQRQIGKVEKWMLPYYENPLESVQKYVDEAAFKISARKFLGKQLKYAPGDQAAKLKELEGGIKDSYQSSVGSGVQVSDSLAGKIAEAIGRQQDLNLNNEQIVRLQKIIQERFKGTGGNEFLDGMRTFNYFGTIGNFGTTITQLMDLVNVGWFAGWDNATQAAFRRGQRDFFSEMGLDTNNGVDWSMTSGGMNKALDKVLTWTGFNKLDKWAKNTALNALYKKWSSKARKDEVGTLAELTERYGKEDAPAILEQLKNWDGSIDGNTPTPKEIQYLLFDQASDFLPISRLEMPEAAGGTYGPLLFQLKSYLVKQLDIYREITEKDLTRANELYKQGRKAEAAKLGAKAAGKWSLYAATLMASGASTDAIKDKAYGRPVELDEIIQNNLLRLALINRYHRYQLEREGIGKTALGMVMPATTVFDRISKDMTAFAKGEQVKGHSLQGTILDPIYWYVEGMGGYEKKNK